jgi:uncharacterized RDD family membrane protein YckC
VEVERYRASIAGGAPSPAATAAPAVAPPAAALPAAPAGFWIRVGAELVDAVVIAIGQRLLAIPAWLIFAYPGSGRSLASAIDTMSGILVIAYFIVCHWRWGQTVGKMAFRIRVVSMAGGPLTLGQAVLRLIGAWISSIILGIGFLMVAFRSDKRGLHDLIAGTRVERLP